MGVTRQFVVALVLSFLPAGESCGPTGQHFFNRVTIDRNLHLSTIGNEIDPEPTSGQYYSIFYAAHLNAVDHFKRHSAADRERLLYLETNRNQLLRTEKEDEVLRGPFGTVYATKECRFEGVEKTYLSSVSVGGKPNGSGELPSYLSSWPDDRPPLTSFSLVRIFTVAREHLVIAANYEANGVLSSLHISGARNGDWLLPRGGGDYLRVDATDQRLKSYGIPYKVDLPRYFRVHSLVLPKVQLEEEKNFAIQVYGFNRLIRLDELRSGASVSSKYLRPSITEEEKLLNPVCDARFGQQLFLGLPTVQ